MSETKPPSAAAEQMAKDLKTTLVQCRPHPWRIVLITLAISTLLLAGMSWWFYPGPRLDPLQIVALDEICAPGEKLTVRAQLYELQPSETPRRMQGHTIIFLEPPPLLPQAVKTRTVVEKSDEEGRASTDWPTPATAVAEYRAEHIDLAERAKSLDYARVFICAKDASLFVVDADEALKADKVDAKAVKALTQASAEGWQIIYLAVASEKAVEYRRTRDWILAQPALPRGPVLGRASFADAAAPGALLASLRVRFTGKMAALVKSAKPIDGIVGVASWADVPVRLKK